ncbi:MAG: efflux RND transporter periplasmic adaptor subunit [Pseudomonadota bacterium]
MKKVFLLVFLVLISMTIAACTQGQRDWLGKFFAGGGSTVPVAVENVKSQEQLVFNVVRGTVQASDVVEVKLPNEVRISKVFVNEGDYVTAGQVLCQLSEEDTKLDLARLRVNLRDKQSELDRNLYFFRNRDRLLEEERINQDQYDRLEEDVEKNEKEMSEIRTKISGLEEKNMEVDVKSPIAGVVSRRIASPGIIIQENQSLFEITQINPISVVFSLVPYEAKAVRAGMPVQVQFRDLPGEKKEAQITAVGSQIDEETGRFEVQINIPNPENIYKVGMVAQVEFEAADKQRFFNVPEEAVIADKRRHYVFTVSGGIAHKVPVVIKDKKDGRIEIVKGLMDNDLVVIKGNDRLEEGSVVEIWGQ